MYKKYLSIRKIILVLNAFAILLYSPNYISLVYPVVKLLPLFVFSMSVGYILISSFSRSRLNISFILLFFLVSVFVTSVISFVRFENEDVLVFALSFSIKIISIVICYNLIRSKQDFLCFVNSLLLMLGLISAHAILQSVLFSFGVVQPSSVIETQGYIYQNLDWAGFYRVSTSLWDVPVLRAQSFFQEPGFLAFYLCCGLFLARLVSIDSDSPLLKILSLLLGIGILVTFSFTGIVILIVFILTINGYKVTKIFAAIISCVVLFWVLGNSNEYISKAGSALLRINDFLNVIQMLYEKNVLISGVGYGVEAIFTESRVNNFVVELFMYSSAIGFLVCAIGYSYLLIRVGFYKMSLFHVALFYALSTPMFWSPLVLLCYVITDLYHEFLYSRGRSDGFS